jgi:hypothetical protein
MIDHLKLTNFKNFQEAGVGLGPFTVLIGANASGKSNIRDAFRFLHGIGRGYSLPEILGEKYVGGERVWDGVRGGTREVAYSGSDSFGLRVDLRATTQRVKPPGPHSLRYLVEVTVNGLTNKPPQIEKEALIRSRLVGFEVTARLDKNNIKTVFRRERRIAGRYPPSRTYISGTPVISQVADDEVVKSRLARAFSKAIMEELESFRFLDLSPTQMRIPSLPGQKNPR